MNTSRLALTLGMLCVLLAPALRAQDVLITPSAITSSTSASDLSPAGNLINGSGLSGTPTLAALGTHAASGNINAWVTASSSPDYFLSLPQPVLTCTLSSGRRVSEVVLWGFDGNSSEAKSFDVAFSTDNGTSFANAVLVNKSSVLGTGAVRLPLPGGPRLASHVRVTVTDNHFGTGVGGDRVVLGELRFAAAPEFFVMNTADSGPGSLRQAIADAGSAAGADVILFASGLSGQTITLGSEIVLGSEVTLDASGLPGGLTLDGGSGTNRVFSVNTGTKVTLLGLTLTGGGGTGAGLNNYGGAIYNNGTLTLQHCTLTGNTAGSVGGAIFNGNTLTLTQCTLSGNSSAHGGAIANTGPLTLTHCTLAGNQSTGTAAFNGGGAIYNYAGAALTLTSCILAGNTSASVNGPDLWMKDGTVTASTCLISDGDDSTLTHGANGNLVGTAAAPIDARLSPLGNYGGPTRTMQPQSGSPAIDAAAVISALTTDQRGYARNLDGDGNGTATPDMGAVEHQRSVIVTTTADENDPSASSGTGISLREAIRDGADIITFAPGLSGGTISLSNGGTLALARSVTIDASSLANGITINGNATGSVFYTTGGTVVFTALTLTNGNGLNGFGGGGIYNTANLTLNRCTLSGNSTGFNGGAIFNFSTLTLTQCTLSGNTTARDGGAIYSRNGTLTLTQCSLSGNTTARDGGAIYSGTANITGPITSSTTLTHCTLTGNTATTRGGGIHNDRGRTTLTHCTLSANTAPAGAGSGVSSYGDTVTETVVQNCIISGNTGSSVDFVWGSTNSFTSLGGNLIGSGNATGDFNGAGNIINNAPQLAPLGNYGGPTQTMPPLAGSPAIDAATAIGGLTTDQRGFARNVDGDGTGGAAPDIGAVEVRRVVVTNSQNGGAGSLRQALADDASGTTPADLIVFAPGLSGGTITLNSEIVISSVEINATSLPAGLTITDTGDVNYRLFSVSSGTTVTLRGLTLANGGGPSFTDTGGAIANNGTLTLTQCSLSGNSANFGGAITNGSGTLVLTHCTLSGNSTANDGGAIYDNAGTLTLTQCTLSGNSAGFAGAIFKNVGTLTLTHCTLSGNSAATSAGAIFNQFGTLVLTQCTLSGNSADDDGGAIANGGTLTLTNTLVAGNTAADRPDIYRNSGTITATGVNLIGNLAGSGLSAGSTVLVGAPQLAPLGNYGGPTQTMALLPGSAARDAAVGPIPNPSFEADHFTANNGYANANGGTITGWTLSHPESIGLNPANTSFFANNGAIPHGNNVAFIQNDGGIISLSTTITGLTAGVNYTVTFRTNSREGYNAPTTTWSLNGGADAPFTCGPAVGGTNPYYTVQGTFTATSATAPLVIKNTGGGGDSVLLDAFTITATDNSPLTTDQRGFPVFGAPDIGAYEAQLGPIANTATNEDTTTAAIAFTVGQVGTLSASSSVPGLVSSFAFGGSGTNRTLTVTPAANQNGSATVTVTDSLANETQTFTLTVNAVNDTPAFTKGADVSVDVGSGAQSLAGWATGITDGDPELNQTLTFQVSNTNNALFATQPAIAVDGTLTFTLNPSNAVGSATVSVSLQDDGSGTAPNVRTSAVQTFTLTVVPLSTAVTATTDSGPGSLRQALLNAAVNAGPDTITFGPGFTGPVVLGSEIVISSEVTIDGGSSGMTLDGGPGTNRLFTVASGTTAVLKNLTLTGGNGAGTISNGHGGAIYNNGTLTMTQCVLSGNSVTNRDGGAIRNAGTLTLTQCTLSGNAADIGGGIYNNASKTLILTLCSLSGNTAADAGGAIFNTGTATLTQCTLSGNSSAYSGGGIESANTLTLNNSIVAGNTATNNSPDISLADGSVSRTGHCLIGNNDSIATAFPAGAPNGNGDIVGTSASPALALLAPLSSNGGPTQTMALLPGSPALDAGTVISGLNIDQRGLPRNRDGDGTPGALPDIGAYESQAAPTVGNPNPIVVTTATDELDAPGTLGTGVSLREAVQVALAGTTVTFDPALSGQTAMQGSEIVISKAVTLDASGLPGGFTISGNDVVRLFKVNNGQSFTLHSLTLTDGFWNPPSFNVEGGGAIYNEGGTLTLMRCTVMNCVADFSRGGAIANNSGTATLTHCTLDGNTSYDGGSAIYNYNSGTLRLTHCTLSGNALGRSMILNSGTTTLINSIVAANAAGADGNILNLGTVIREGTNIVPSASDPSPSTITALPMLAPLANYGGPTPTRPPLPGSPALDQATVLNPPLTSDQRGQAMPLGVRPDIGAVEGSVIIVTTAADELDAPGTPGAGVSMREAIRDVPAGGVILFDGAIFTGATATTNTITLTKGPLNPQRSCTLSGALNPAGIKILHTLTITQQPVPLSVASGVAVNFSVTVTDLSGGLAYQWRKNSAANGTTTAALNLANVQESDEALYDVVLSEAAAPGALTLDNVTLTPASGTSQPASLIVNGSPVTIQRSPASRLIPLGGSHTLSVVAVGPATPALTYQWTKAGKNISGATKSSYTLTNAQLSSAGAYNCIVKSGTALPGVTSNSAEIGVVDTRTISVTRTLPTTSFTITVGTAGTGLTYVWLKDGAPYFANTQKTLLIETVTIAERGLYSCRVTGPSGDSVIGGSVQLSLISGPPVLDIPLAPPAATIGQSYYWQVPVLPFAGQGATSFSLTGTLPTGITFNKTTGVLSGRPTTTKTGGYALSFKATNAKGTTPAAPATLNVNVVLPTAVGTFAGPMDRSTLNDNLGGRFDLTTTSAGLCSGSITLGARTKIPFTNQLLLSAGTGDVILHANIPNITLANKTVLLAYVEVFAADQRAVLTLVHPTLGTTVITPAWRNPWLISKTPALNNPATAYAAYYTARLDCGNAANAPQGYGYTSFTVSTAGTLTLAGKLPDGSAITGGAFVSKDGEIALFNLLYANRGSHVGQFVITPGTPVTNNVLNGTTTWSKPGPLTLTSTDTVYKNGFDPLTVTTAGSPYIAPLAGQRVLGLPAVISPNTNAKLSYTLGGLDVEVKEFSQALRIDNLRTTTLTNTFFVPLFNAALNPNPNPNRVTMSVLTASTGAISGNFTMPGATTPLNRAAPWSGQIVRIGTSTQGYGYFLLPTVPVAPKNVSTSPKLSGRIVLGVP